MRVIENEAKEGLLGGVGNRFLVPLCSIVPYLYVSCSFQYYVLVFKKVL